MIITEAAEQIICCLSDAGWDIISGRYLRELLRERPDPIDMRVLEFCHFDKDRLGGVFNSEHRDAKESS